MDTEHNGHNGHDGHDGLYEEVKHHPSIISMLHTPSSPPTYDRVIETREIRLSKRSDKSIVSHLIHYGQKDCLSCGVANIQLHNQWKSASLVLGGSTIDTIHQICKTSHFEITNENRCIPFTTHHPIDLFIYTLDDNDVVFTYDIVHISGGEPAGGIEYVFRQQEFTGTEPFDTIANRRNRVRTCFTHPLYSLKVYSSVPIENVIFKVLRSREFTIPLVQISEYEWEYTFGDKPVASLGGSEWIEFDALKPGTLDVVASSYNHMRMMSGMYGVKYSK